MKQSNYLYYILKVPKNQYRIAIRSYSSTGTPKPPPGDVAFMGFAIFSPLDRLCRHVAASDAQHGSGEQKWTRIGL